MLQRRQRLSSVTHQQSTGETPPRKKAKLSPSQSTKKSGSKSDVKVLTKGKSPKNSTKKKNNNNNKKKSSSSSKSDKKSNTRRIETTRKHYEVIDAILQFSVHYCHPLGRVGAYSGFSQEGLPFFAFPVFTRKPVGRAQLPVVPESDKTDVGYFLGAAHPGHIRLAVIDAFCKCFPNEDPKAARWEFWDVWQYLSCYYPPDIFNRKPEILQDLAGDILTGREFGGLGRTYPKVVSTIDQKLYKYAVHLSDYYDAVGFPIEKDNILNQFAVKTFFPMNTLLSLHEAFKQKLSEKKGADYDEPVKLKKRQTKKRLQKAEEMDVDSSDEVSGDSESSVCDENQPSQDEDSVHQDEDSSDDEPGGDEQQNQASTETDTV